MSRYPETPAETDGGDLLVDALARWYAHHRRSLPWRETDHPYPIWIAEVMLQQTRVSTVVPYYHRFLARFPTVFDLAAAGLDEVLKVWEGLGFYARCRNLHKSAKIIVEQYAGEFPRDFEAALSLPGVGRSTAGAVLSFAYGQRYPVLDGNVRRVLLRLGDIHQKPSRSAVVNRLWARASALVVKASEPAEHNQAMMELGALICTPKQPDCPTCPIQSNCRARIRGTQEELPIKRRKRTLPFYEIGVGVIWREGKVLIQLRPAEGLLGGLWEFPGGKRKPFESIEACVRREIDEELSLWVEVGDPIATIDYAYSHFKVRLHAYHCHYLSGTAIPRSAQAFHWVDPEQLCEYAFPKANHRILQRLLER